MRCCYICSKVLFLKYVFNKSIKSKDMFYVLHKTCIMSQQGKRKTAQDSSQPKKRVVLTHVQKHQLCLDFEKTLRPTQEELAIIYKIKQNTIFDILKKKGKWLLIDPDSEEASKQRERLPCFSQV